MSVSTLVALLLAAGPAATSLIDLYVGGDDGLTIGLADAIRDESAKLVASGPMVTITIPSNVEWSEVKGRTRVSFVAEIEGPGGSKVVSGQCWEDNLKKCARLILKTAKQVRSNPETLPKQSDRPAS